jgi:DNA-binding MarR family transcriptional regulator
MDETELAAQLRLVLVPLVRQLRLQNGPELTAGRASALATIAKAGPLTVGELAEREHVSSPMITKIAKSLEEMGLVSRTADESDRRVTRLTLTPEGTKVLEHNRTRKNAWLAQRLRSLAPGEREALEAVLPVLERVVAQGSGSEQGLPARTARP